MTLRTKEQITYDATEKRIARIQDAYADRLATLDQDLESDIMNPTPRGYAATWVSSVALRSGQEHDLLWYLRRLGYKCARGGYDPRPQRLEIFVYWDK